MNKVRALLQAVGFLTLALLALYGVLAFAGGAGPLPGALSAQAQEVVKDGVVAAPAGVDALANAVTGNLDTKVYQWYEAGLTNNGSPEMQTQLTEMGRWDYCSLVGNAVQGVDSEYTDWGTCFIAPSLSEIVFGPKGPYTFDRTERPTWFLRAALGGRTDRVQCEAVCMNIGSR